jgi:hypothetical protein
MPFVGARRCAFLAIVALLAPTLALGQAATVDQVLAAVAEVVRDRAKQVATRAIARNLAENLCSGEVRLPPYRPRVQEGRASPAMRTFTVSTGAGPSDVPRSAGEPSFESPLVLTLGGKRPCRRTYLREVVDADPGHGEAGRAAPSVEPELATTADRCDADDVFIRTCRAAKRLEVPLTDPYLLKSLSRDTIDFLMRVAARNLSAPVYEESGLVELGAFIHTVLEQLGQQKPNAGELAGPTLALADKLSAGVPRRTFKDLQSTDVPRTLELALERDVVDPWLASSCAPYETARGAKPAAAKNLLPRSCRREWFIAPAGAPPETLVDCDIYERSRFDRRQVFDTIFGTRREEGPLYAGRDQACAAAFPKPETPGVRDDKRDARMQCHQARLAFNLYGSLVRARCAPRLGDVRVRSAFRELGYVVAEQGVYRAALEELPVDPASVGTLDGFLDAVQKLDLADLPREELATGVRLAGLYAAARDAAPEGTSAWLELLARDLKAEVRSPAEDSYSRLLHGDALGTEIPLSSPAVEALAAGVKDLLTVPALAVVRHQRELDDMREVRAKLTVSVETARAAVRRLLEALDRDPAGAGSFRDYVGAIAAFLSDLGDVTAAMGKALEDSRVMKEVAPNLRLDVESAISKLPPEERGAVFARAAMAMKQGALALELASERDWVGLGIRVSDEISRVTGAGGKIPELERSLRFARVLLSMYQAPSVDEAKAIFAANLEDASSRERRWDDGGSTVDVGALLGFAVGRQYSHLRTEGQPTQRDHARLYGVFAPFGVQVAKGLLGVLAYPVDLGSYLTTTVGDGRDWRDALRPGGAFLIRPSGAIPLVLAVGADYRFEIDGEDERRWYVTGALELPLFTIH